MVIVVEFHLALSLRPCPVLLRNNRSRARVVNRAVADLFKSLRPYLRFRWRWFAKRSWNDEMSLANFRKMNLSPHRPQSLYNTKNESRRQFYGHLFSNSLFFATHLNRLAGSGSFVSPASTNNVRPPCHSCPRWSVEAPPKGPSWRSLQVRWAYSTCQSPKVGNSGPCIDHY